MEIGDYYELYPGWDQLQKEGVLTEKVQNFALACIQSFANIWLRLLNEIIWVQKEVCLSCWIRKLLGYEPQMPPPLLPKK